MVFRARRAACQTWVSDVSGVGGGAHSPSAARAAVAATTGRGTPRARGRAWYCPPPHSESSTCGLGMTGHRRRASAITVPYLSTSSTSAMHVPIHYLLVNTVPPLLISFYYCTPCSHLSHFPVALFLGARLSFEARYPAGGCGPDRRGAPQRAIAHWRSRGLCPSRGGPTAGILEWPPHRVGGLHCGLSIVTPPARACVRVSPIAHSGERGWLVQRDVSLFLGLNAGIYESPAHRVGRLDL